jgi:hypothetical protein
VWPALVVLPGVPPPLLPLVEQALQQLLLAQLPVLPLLLLVLAGQQTGSCLLPLLLLHCHLETYQPCLVHGRGA